MAAAGRPTEGRQIAQRAVALARQHEEHGFLASSLRALQVPPLAPSLPEGTSPGGVLIPNSETNLGDGGRPELTNEINEKAGFYVNGDPRPGVATARQLQGKQLSYNNLNDTDAAYECVAEFDPARRAFQLAQEEGLPASAAHAYRILIFFLLIFQKYLIHFFICIISIVAFKT